MFLKFLCLAYLGLESIIDYREKSIRVIHILSFMLVSLVVSLMTREEPIKFVLGGAAVGLVMLGICFATKGKVGIGDGLSLVVTGICLGIYDNLSVFIYGTILSGVYASAVYIKRKNGDSRIAFLPFLLVGYVVKLFTEVCG